MGEGHNISAVMPKTANSCCGVSCEFIELAEFGDFGPTDGVSYFGGCWGGGEITGKKQVIG